MPLTDSQWEKFLGELKKKKCCLLLGTEINCLVDDQGRSQTVLEAFASYMEKRLEQEGITFDKTINNFYYRADKFISQQYPTQDFRFEDEIKEFSKQVLSKLPEYFSKLVKLPFNSIITMTPDNFAASTLADAGYEFVGEFYDYSDQARKNIELSEEMQLVYNVFGSYEARNSVAVTEKEQLAQIKSLVSESKGFPNPITNRFKDVTKSFLFLGFNFNDWQLRLIIDALQIPRPNFSFYPIYSDTHEVGLMAREFYSEKFGMKFIEPDTDVFLKELIKRYEDAYGSLDRKLLCVLDYQDDELKYLNALKDQLKKNGIAKRMEFFDKTDISGQDMQLLDQKAIEADLYIPFISSSFIGDGGCAARLNRCMAQDETSIVPIVAGYSSYDTAFPALKKKQSIILPRGGKALSSYPDNELVQVCYEIARNINRVIR